MRTLLAIAIIAAAMLALPDPADARRSAYRARPPAYTVQPRYYQPRYYDGPQYYRPPRYAPPRPYGSGDLACEERAQAADPTGLYAGYPCWAREAFGRSPGGRR